MSPLCAVMFSGSRSAPALPTETSARAFGAEYGDIVPGVNTPVLAKHSKNFLLVDAISVGVDRMQRNFESMRRQIDAWRETQIADVTAKLVIYEAFVEGDLDVPRHLARLVHERYFPSAVRGVPAADGVEPVKCLHLRIPAVGRRAAVPGDG